MPGEKDKLKREYEINDRFGDSRANIFNLLFTTLATSNGVALAAIIGLFNDEVSYKMATYISILVLLLGVGMITIILSGFIRFEHSRISQKVQLAKLENNGDNLKKFEKRRKPYHKIYRGLMWSSLVFFIAAIFLAFVTFILHIG